MKFMKLGSKPDTFRTDGKNTRTVATELTPDLIIHVGDVKFYLHKFPLLAKSSRLQRLLGSANDESSDEINILDIPGGPKAFEICAKFCYGMTVTLNAYNVITARCAAEYLDMNESVEKGNLVYKIEVFLNSSVFRGWKDSIIVLQTTKSLLPWSEDLKLVTRCIDSIASKVSVEPSKVDWSYTYNRKKLPSENGVEPHWNGVRKEQSVPNDWWVEDLCDIGMDFYRRIILSVKAKSRVASEVIGEALKAYTYKKLSSSASSTADATKKRSLVEIIISLLPTEKKSVSCSFLLKLLRGVSLLDCGEKSKHDLIKRIGLQLEDASMPDLLIPPATGQDTTYDVDIVMRIVEEFVMQDNIARQAPYSREELHESRSQSLVSPSSKVAVAKLVDGYLVEVAKDRNLPLSKFIRLAEMVSGDSRPVHDGIYRAIDMYLKEHQGLSKGERKRLCCLLDCKKLSMDACMHAVQNDRLPLRLVVQVLFEHMRASAVSSNCAESGGSYGSSRSVITTNTEDECVALPSNQDLKSFNNTKPAGAGTTSERSSSSNNLSLSIGHDKDSDAKLKGMLKTKNILGKLLLNKSVEDSSSSDTSGSPGSTNMEEPKLTPSRTTRYSVS